MSGTLDAYLGARGAQVTEGHIGQLGAAMSDLQRLAASTKGQHMLEIGFNAGHSADRLLSACPEATLISFDVGLHSYGAIGKEYIDKKHIGRHRLVIGDSNNTVPQYEADHKCDFIFIDGGHDGETPWNDITNCKRLAHEDTIVVVDDIVQNNPAWIHHWNVAPTRAWLKAIAEHVVVQDGMSEYSPGRGMRWGRYVV